jgi:hypothetical protein
MRAERDEEETVRAAKRTPERRLAYEIATGIILGGLGLALIQSIFAVIAWQVYVHDLKMAFSIPTR